MENYKELIKYLKVCYQNISTLHHNLVSETFLSDHEHLANLYEMVGNITDDLVELGIMQGLKEPTINESIEDYETIDTITRDSKETWSIVLQSFNSLIEIGELAKVEMPDFIKNKIEEYEYSFAKEIYKIEHIIGERL